MSIPPSTSLPPVLSCDTTQAGAQMERSYILGPHGETMTMLDGGGNWKWTNVYAGGKLLATYTADTGSTHFHFTDMVGTRRMTTDYQGWAEIGFYSLPFGDGLTPVDPAIPAPTADYAPPMHFTGKERDQESGNDYFGARYYASSMGRFLSPDWAEIPSNVPYATFGDPQSLNLYSYGLNNPLKNRDFDGHSCDPDSSYTDSQGAVHVVAGQCHLDWWDLPGHAFVGFSNILMANNGRQFATGVGQMAYAYASALPVAQFGLELGAADSLVSLGLEVDDAGAANAGAGAQVGDQSVDVTKGKSIKNWSTPATPDQVGKTLESNGFTKQTLSDGSVQYTSADGSTQCTMYPKASSTGGPSMQVKVNDQVVSKVRMK